jgi:molecular chaperone GrpE
MQENPDSANDTPRATPADMPAPDATAAAQAGTADPAELQRELEDARDRYLRLAAEFDNYRKRTSNEAQQLRSRGQGELIKTLLDSLDDLARFAHLDPAQTDAKTVVEGAAMVEKNLHKALARAGVEVIDPLELPFDPNLHEAVSTAPAEIPEEDHMVGQVYQRGYMLNGQLLRPARVVVKQY